MLVWVKKSEYPKNRIPVCNGFPSFASPQFIKQLDEDGFHTHPIDIQNEPLVAELLLSGLARLVE